MAPREILSPIRNLLRSVITGIANVITELQTVRVLDHGNTTVANLGNGGVFEGDWFDALPYASVTIEVKTDQVSAVDGLRIQSSDDQLTVRHPHKHTLEVGDNHHFTYTLSGRYYRVVYTNGTTPTTSFRIGTVFSKTDQSHQHTHGVEHVISSSHPADLVRSVLTAKRADNAYANIQSTNGNNLKISLEEFESAISSNGKTQLNVTQYDSSGLETHRIADNPEFFEDAIFVTGDSPVTLDLNDALGRNATQGWIRNDGPGDFTVSFSTDGASFGDAITMKTGERLPFSGVSVDSLRIAWVEDSAYRVAVI